MSEQDVSLDFRLIRRQEVELLTGLSTSSIYAGIKAGTFPRPIPIGRNAVAWISVEIDDWIAQRVAVRARRKSLAVDERTKEPVEISSERLRRAIETTAGNRLIRREEVEKKTGKSRSAIYAEICTGTFPEPVAISSRAVAWLEREIDAWVIASMARREQRSLSSLCGKESHA